MFHLLAQRFSDQSWSPKSFTTDETTHEAQNEETETMDYRSLSTAGLKQNGGKRSQRRVLGAERVEQRSAALLGQLRRLVAQSGGLGPRSRRGLHVHTLGHLHADDVHQALEDLPHVDVLLGAGLVVLEACGGTRRSDLPVPGFDL